MSYLHFTSIPRLLNRLDPADVGDAAVQEGAGLADEHAQSQRRPVRLCGGAERREESQEVSGTKGMIRGEPGKEKKGGRQRK